MPPGLSDILLNAGLAGAILGTIVSLAIIWSRYSLAKARLETDRELAALARGVDPDHRATNPGTPSTLNPPALMSGEGGQEGGQHFESVDALIHSSAVGEVLLERGLSAAIVDEEATIVYANDRLKTLLGRDRVQIEGKNYYDEISEPDSETDKDRAFLGALFRGEMSGGGYILDLRTFKRLAPGVDHIPVPCSLVVSRVPRVTWGSRRLRLVVIQVEDHSMLYRNIDRADRADERATSLEGLCVEERAARDSAERELRELREMADALTAARSELAIAGKAVPPHPLPIPAPSRRHREPRRQRTEVEPAGRVVVTRVVTPARATPRLERPATAIGLPSIATDDERVALDLTPTTPPRPVPPAPPSGIRKPRRGESDEG